MKKIKISSPDKILFPKDKITKLQIVEYYFEVAKMMLPFIKDRTLSVIRCHEGIDKECFFKKHPTSSNDEVNIVKQKKEEYFYINKRIQLIYQVQYGTIEFHINGSQVNNIDKPNMMIFDLDPDEKLPLIKLRQAVEKVKLVLDDLKLISFLKTSGGKGYHIVVPFKKTKDWDSFYEFSRRIAIICENNWPNVFTTNLKKEKRRGKIFIDYLRNNKNATCVAPYSLRTKNKAPISFPIDWKDLYKIKPNQINIKNYKKYLNKSWDNYHKIKQKLI